MPKNIPALAYVQACHLLSKYSTYLNLLFETVLLASKQVVERSKIHKISSIYTNVNSINQMNALFISSDCTWIFDIINN